MLFLINRGAAFPTRVMIQPKSTSRRLRTTQTLHNYVSHLNIQEKTPPNIRRTLAKEELNIGQSIKCSFFWSFYKTSLCK